MDRIRWDGKRGSNPGRVDNQDNGQGSNLGKLDSQDSRRDRVVSKDSNRGKVANQGSGKANGALRVLRVRRLQKAMAGINAVRSPRMAVAVM